MAAKSPFRRIALMVDGSDAGLEAAKLAVAIASYAGAELCAFLAEDVVDGVFGLLHQFCDFVGVQVLSE